MTFPCCRHCAPASPWHPADRDQHTTACGCSECPYPTTTGQAALW